MSQPAALPTRPARTMLNPVLGSAIFRGPRKSVARWVRVAVLGVAALAALLPSASAFAQDADDNGWFDGESQQPTPEPYYDVDTSPPPAPAAAPAPEQQDVADNDPSALTTFRPALDPYGAWVNDSKYGTVWVPNREVVGEDFAPYVSRGHWALTSDEDWMWQSDYPFGWAVFHYGRWVWMPGHGWAWVPGRTYANAWVVWRTPSAGYSYVGWAPMPPTWGWYNGYAYGVWYSPPLPYVFCPSAYAFDYRVHSHIVRDRRLVNDIASHSRVYPTPYRVPAQPGVHTAGAPGGGVRPLAAPMRPSAAPRGPAMSAARIPSQAIPAVRSQPTPAATRLSGNRITRADYSMQRSPSSSPEARMRSSASPRVPADSRAFTGEDVRRSAPSRSWSEPRPAAVERMRVEPRSYAPARVHVSPPSPSRTYTQSPARSAPSHSFSPSRSFSPSMPRMHGGGGGGGHRR